MLYLPQVFVARGAGVGQPLENHGWFAMPLENPLKFADKDMNAAGKLCVYAEELLRSKQLVSWQMSANGIVSRDRFHGSLTTAMLPQDTKDLRGKWQ